MEAVEATKILLSGTTLIDQSVTGLVSFDPLGMNAASIQPSTGSVTAPVRLLRCRIEEFFAHEVEFREIVELCQSHFGRAHLACCYFKGGLTISGCTFDE